MAGSNHLFPCFLLEGGQFPNSAQEAREPLPLFLADWALPSGSGGQGAQHGSPQYHKQSGVMRGGGLLPFFSVLFHPSETGESKLSKKPEQDLGHGSHRSFVTQQLPEAGTGHFTHLPRHPLPSRNPPFSDLK